MTQWIENTEPFDQDLKMVQESKPANGYNRDTQQYWYAKITSAIKKLNISERASNARRNKKFATYKFDDKVTVNALSRKLIAKANNIVTDNPEVTPIFREFDDENIWRDKITAYVKDNIRKQHVKDELRAILWDNFTGDIGWGKIDYVTRFSAGTPTRPSAEKQRAIAERQRIIQENWGVVQGIPPLVGPEDIHALHIELHESTKQDLAEQVRMGMVPPEALDMLDIHISAHREADVYAEEEQLQFRRWPSYLVYYDPDALRWDDVDWYAVEMIERREVLLGNEELKNVNRLKGMPGLRDDPYHERGAIDAGNVLGGTSDDVYPTETYLRYWIIHDKVVDQIVVIAQQEKYDQKPLLINNWPYPGDIVKPYVLNPVNDQIHGVSECERLSLLHNELIEVRKKISHYCKRVPVAKIFAAPAVLNKEGWSRDFNDPFKILCPTQHGGNEVKIFQWPGLDQHLLQHAQRLDAELNEESGVPEFAQAAVTDESATATAARDRQFGNKIADAKDQLGKLVEWYCEMLVDVTRENGTIEQMVRIIGSDGMVTFDRFLPSDLPYGVAWLVDTDSFSPTRRELFKKQQLEFLTAISPFLMPGPVIDPKDILARLIRLFDGPEDMSRIFIQQQQPMLPLNMQVGASGMPPGGGMGGAQNNPMAMGQQPMPPEIADRYQQKTGHQTGGEAMQAASAYA